MDPAAARAVGCCHHPLASSTVGWATVVTLEGAGRRIQVARPSELVAAIEERFPI
ncbi:hypothetical protein [Kribbella sancticallisti]|uniref:hypothetical protein n=1 Tax=Kribbella sancticallisti TaxID=460087 RepID=UPI0031DB71F3